MEFEHSQDTLGGVQDGLRPSRDFEKISDFDPPSQQLPASQDYGLGSKNFLSTQDQQVGFSYSELSGEQPPATGSAQFEFVEENGSGSQSDLTDQKVNPEPPHQPKPLGSEDEVKSQEDPEGDGSAQEGDGAKSSLTPKPVRGPKKRSQKRRRRNPKLLLLDFKDGVDIKKCHTRLMWIHRELFPNATAKKDRLPRGGFKITFKSSKSRKLMEEVVRDDSYLREQLRGGYVRSKKSWQVKIDNATPEIKSDFDQMDGVLKTHLTPRRRLIISVTTLEMAQQLVKDGYWKEFTVRPIDPWVRRPILGCRSCGSLDHRSCQSVRCFTCGQLGHKSSECQTDPKCLHCSESHDSRRCPTLKERRKKAFDRKRKSYRDVLISRPTPTEVVEEKEEEVAASAETKSDEVTEPKRTQKSDGIDPNMLIPLFLKMLRLVMPAFLEDVQDDMFDVAEELLTQAMKVNGIGGLPDSDDEVTEEDDASDDTYEAEEIELGNTSDGPDMNLDVSRGTKRGRSDSPTGSRNDFGNGSKRLQADELDFVDMDADSGDDDYVPPDTSGGSSDIGTPIVKPIGKSLPSGNLNQQTIITMLKKKSSKAKLLKSKSNNTTLEPSRPPTKSRDRKTQTSSRADRGQ